MTDPDTTAPKISRRRALIGAVLAVAALLSAFVIFGTGSDDDSTEVSLGEATTTTSPRRSTTTEKPATKATVTTTSTPPTTVTEITAAPAVTNPPPPPKTAAPPVTSPPRTAPPATNPPPPPPPPPAPPTTAQADWATPSIVAGSLTAEECAAGSGDILVKSHDYAAPRSFGVSGQTGSVDVMYEGHSAGAHGYRLLWNLGSCSATLQRF